MKRVVVTGSEGQLGQSIKSLLKRDDGFSGIIPIFVDLNDFNLADPEASSNFFQNHECDWVINCAAYTNVEKAEEDIEGARKGNVDTVNTLVEIAKEKGFRLIHISTDYVFDGDNDKPFKEDDAPNPTSVYGKTKLLGEQRIIEGMKESLIIRTSWLYSPFGRNFFLTMRNKAMSGEKVRVVNDQKGTPTYSMDLAHFLLTVVKANLWYPGVYHYSNQGETTWYEFTKEIYKLLGTDVSLVTPILSSEYSSNVKRPFYSVLDKTKVTETFGISIPGWEKSLIDAIRYFKD